ncbi:DUF4157 domain-containing protein [Plantactinospora sp. ZYX-F-223]|uniref:eCIS core domain-containing protein n=1 Tax=Plantactinospora sp. ZYX-F-223 TaxID=3144103 RepID=UPI0031FDA042
MRAHDPASRDVRAHPAQPNRPANGPAAPTGSAAAILALQRQAGNAAVNEAIQRLRTEIEPGQEDGHHEPDSGLQPGPEPVQRSAVHEVLRSAGTPLAEPVRRDMEARLGADFSDVRLHTGALAQRSAAEVDARAYTSGSHVVIGQGGADRHTLAHELTHVIQQRSGPVAGSEDGHGLRISDPGDAFERAAEANARQALGQRPARPETHETAEPAGPPSGTPAVQRVMVTTHDELHSEPPGPSITLRGPGQPGTAHQVGDQQTWDMLSLAHRASTGRAPGTNQPIDLDTDLTSLIEMSPETATGQQLGRSLGSVAEQAGIPRTVGSRRRDNAEMMELLGREDPATRPYWEAQAARDQQLAHDAVARAGRYQQEDGAQDAQATRNETAMLLDGISAPADVAAGLLLLGRDGLVVGGSHTAEAFFPWATDNMAKLYTHGVRTLYLEAFREDAHQRLVDDYLSSGTMSPQLANFCKTYQSKWDLVPFLAAARATGMRIKGIASRPARRAGASMEEQQHRRAVMMNTYGEQVIRWDRAMLGGGGNPSNDPGKYLVQVGAAHARTHTNTAPNPVEVEEVRLPNQFPGINELLNVPAVRLEDRTDGDRSFRPI